MNSHTIVYGIGRRNGDFLLVDATSAHPFVEVAKHAQARPRGSVAVVRNALLIVDRLLSDSGLGREFRAAIEAERDKLRKSLPATEQR